jgi:hypothetical protein
MCVCVSVCVAVIAGRTCTCSHVNTHIRSCIHTHTGKIHGFIRNYKRALFKQDSLHDALARCVCVCVFIYVIVCICICVSMYMYIYIYMREYVYMYICECVCIYM